MTPAAARHSDCEMVIKRRKKPLKEAFRMRLERWFGRMRPYQRCIEPPESIVRRQTQKIPLSQDLPERPD